jgi:hypothetical protein
LCSNDGCETPVNYITGGIRNKCGVHGGLPLCSNDGCETPVIYKDGGIRNNCIRHGGLPLCSNDGCKTPVKYITGGIRNRCSVHGGYPLCSNDGCETPVNYKDGGVRNKCIRHGGYPLCSNDGCETPVQYKDGGIRNKCSVHGGLPRCMNCHLFSVQKQGLRCSYCRPESATAKWAKKEEQKVTQLLQDAGLVFQAEVHIHYRCIDSDAKRFARLDFVLELPHKRVILEVDERQHKDVTYEVSCDLSRMCFVMSAIACDQNVRPTVWIRFNPNGFTVDGVGQRVSRKRKNDRLLALIQDTVVFEGTRLIYMYYDYDTQKGLPTICQDPAYDPKVKAMLGPSIVN